MLKEEIKLLIVDDEEFLRMTLIAFLEDEGYMISSVSSGEEALELISKQNFDIGIIDMKLPGINGNTLILQAHDIQPDMKFLIHTGSVNYFVPTSLTEFGITTENILRKPVTDLHTIVKKIDELLSNKNSV